MFTNISWGSYLTAVSILVIGWYLVIILKFYYKDLRRMISGQQKADFSLFKKSKSLTDQKDQNLLDSSFSKSFDTLDDAEELSKRILQAAEESAQKNLTKEQFQNYLRMLLEEYPFVKISLLRESINKLMVSESEKYPELLLTLSEADSLWEGAAF